MRNEDQDTVQTGKSIPQPEISDLYRKAKTNIIGIINTDSALLNITIIPENICSINPCTNAVCEENLNEQHHFECICNPGYGRSTNMRYKCQGLKISWLFFLRNFTEKSKQRRFNMRHQYHFFRLL